MSIDVVIPNYNGANLIEKNLKKVVEALPQEVTTSVIIVDDHSNLDDYEKLKAFVESFNIKSDITVTLLRNSQNYGFSRTVNNGVRASHAEYVMLLNSDVVPHKNFLDPLLADFKSNEKLFGIGCVDESMEGGMTVLRGRGEGSFKRGFLMHRKGDVDKSNETLWISGGSSLIKKEYFDKLNGFDSIFDPFYWEDIDLSYRAKKSGYTILFEKRSRVVHEHEEGAIKKHFKNSRIKKIAYRNQFIFVWKDITDRTMIMSHFAWLPYHMVKAIFNKDIEFFFGFILALGKLPAIISKRRRQKGLFVLTDTEILSS